jgi:3-oxoacyl-[acyl-carrier-protein] synthase III
LASKKAIENAAIDPETIDYIIFAQFWRRKTWHITV